MDASAEVAAESARTELAQRWHRRAWVAVAGAAVAVGAAAVTWSQPDGLGTGGPVVALGGVLIAVLLGLAARRTQLSVAALSSGLSRPVGAVRWQTRGDGCSVAVFLPGGDPDVDEPFLAVRNPVRDADLSVPDGWLFGPTEGDGRQRAVVTDSAGMVVGAGAVIAATHVAKLWARRNRRW